MSSLGIETMPEMPAAKKQGRWDLAMRIGLGVVITFFTWVVVSNMYLLYFGKPLIKH